MKRPVTNDDICKYYVEHPEQSIAQIAIHFQERTRRVYDAIARYKLKKTEETLKNLTSDKDGLWITGTTTMSGYMHEFIGMGLNLERVQNLLLDCWHLFDNEKKEKQPLIKSKKLF